MNKNNNSSLGSKLAVSILFPLFLNYLPANANELRKLDENTSKPAAPSKEDSADYFSKDRRNISKEDAVQAEVLRGKTIEQIRNMLGSNNAKPNFELLLRLGELYVERSDFQRDLEIENWTKLQETWKNSEPKTRGKQPTVNYSNSEAQLHLAVDSFRKLVTAFPKHERTDAALYSLAGVLNRLDDENALLYYKQLIANHPKSSLVPDAHLAMGEYYFDKHKIKDATLSYQQVMDYKEHRAYAFAVYKLGWCHYNNQGVNEKAPGENLHKSISAFKLVVKLSAGQSAKNFNLRDEALRDLVMAFAETEDTDAAWQYFKTIGEEAKFYAMLERLGFMYSDAGKNAKAIDVYTRLVSEAPLRPGMPKIHAKMIELFDLTNRHSDLVLTVKRMHSEFANSNSNWSKANSYKQNLLSDAADLTEKTTHRYGALLHTRGQKTKDQKLESYAAEIYEEYLKTFSNRDSAYDIRYYLADIQFADKKFEVASKNFLMVAKQKPQNGKHLKEAAFMAVAAIAKPNETQKFDAIPPAGQVANPMSIPALRKSYADTIDEYIKLLPSEKDGISMRYTAAQIYFDYGHYDIAIKRFDDLASNLSSTKQGKSALKVVLSYFNEKRDWQKLIDYSKRYQTNSSLTSDPILKKAIEDGLKNGLFSKALTYEKSKQFDLAATAFIEFKNAFANDSNADKALYNASINYFKAGKVEASLNTQQTLLKEFPKSTLAPDVTASVAETYEALAKFELSAEIYNAFAQKWPNDKRSPTALYNAAVLYRGVKQSRKSSSVFAEIYRKYPTHPTANEALFEAARLREAEGDYSGAIASFKIFTMNPSNKGKDQFFLAEAKLIELGLKNKPKDESSRKSLNKLFSILTAQNSPAAPDARRILASIMFNEQEMDQAHFKQAKLSNGAEIEIQAKKKQEILERMAKKYEQIIALANAEFSVASLYRLGELHEEFSQALFNAPAPQGSQQAEINAFKSQLEKVAFPLKAEAYKYYETAFKRSQEVESFSSWTSKTYQKMVELAPDKHREINELSGDTGYLSYRVVVNNETSELAK
ncbi:MAG: tetratricopeptide repeat protein [Proteobacteria bacterium]|nr:tetratricopeptide repeat protein [Pseudomonadota bacterium]